MKSAPMAALVLASLSAAGPAFAAAHRAGWAPRAHANASANHVITIEAMQFTPATLEVHVGDTVAWKNKDPFPHNVTAGSQIKSGDLASGATWKFKAKKQGEYSYVCTLHPGMKGILVVK